MTGGGAPDRRCFKGKQQRHCGPEAATLQSEHGGLERERLD